MTPLQEISCAADVAKAIGTLSRERQLAVLWFVLDAVYGGEAFDVSALPSADAFKQAPIATGTQVQVDTTPTAPDRVQSASPATSPNAGARAVETLVRMGYTAELAERAVEQALFDASAESSRAPSDRELMKRCLAIAARLKAAPKGPERIGGNDRDPMIGEDTHTASGKAKRALAVSLGAEPTPTFARTSNNKAKRGEAGAELLALLQSGSLTAAQIKSRLNLTTGALEQRTNKLRKSGAITKTGYGKKATYAIAEQQNGAAA